MTRHSKERTTAGRKILSLLISALMIVYQGFVPTAAYAVRKVDVTSTGGTWTVQGQPDGTGKVYFGGRENKYGVLYGSVVSDKLMDIYPGNPQAQIRINDGGELEFREAVYRYNEESHEYVFDHWTDWSKHSSDQIGYNIWESAGATQVNNIHGKEQIMIPTKDLDDRLILRVWDEYDYSLWSSPLYASSNFMGLALYNLSVDKNVSYTVDMTNNSFTFAPKDHAPLGLYVDQDIPYQRYSNLIEERSDYAYEYGPHIITVKDSVITGNIITAKEASGIITLNMGYSENNLQTGELNTDIEISNTKIANNKFIIGGSGSSMDFGIFAYQNNAYNPGTLTIKGLQVTGNTVQSTASFSQGVYINSVGLNNGVETVVKDTYFNNNEYKGTAKNDQMVKGLNIYNSGNLVLYKNGHGTIKNNEANFTPAANTTDMRAIVNGLGLYNTGTAYVRGISITDNKAVFKNLSGLPWQHIDGTRFYYENDTNNSGWAMATGVGISNDFSGSLFLTNNTVISGNQAIAEDVSGRVEFSGIGVYSEGEISNFGDRLEITDNHGIVSGNLGTSKAFDENGTQKTVTVGGEYYMEGAGLFKTGRYSGEDRRLNLGNASISGNSFEVKNASSTATSIHMKGGGMDLEGTVFISTAVINNNQLLVGNNAGEAPAGFSTRDAMLEGGGIYLTDFAGAYNITGTTINNNKITFNAINIAPSYIYGDSRITTGGGGIYNWGQGGYMPSETVLSIKDSVVNSNEVYASITGTGSGWGYLSFDAQGGGIFTNGIHQLRLVDTSVNSNSLKAEMNMPSTRYMKEVFMQGGGVYANTDGFGRTEISSSDGSHTISNNSIEFTMAAENKGTLGSVMPYHIELDGGGIFKNDRASYDYTTDGTKHTASLFIMSDQGRLNISGNSITFSNYSGVKRYDDIYARGGGISVMNDVYSYFKGINVKNNSIRMTSTKPGDSGSWFTTGDLDAEGGGIAFSNAYDHDHEGTQIGGADIERADISGNSITINAVSDDASGRGGGLFARLSGIPAEGTYMDLANVNIYNNSITLSSDKRAEAEGGGLWAALYKGYDKSVEIQGVSANNEQQNTITGNTAKAITTAASAEYEQADARGGGVYLYNYQQNGESGSRTVDIKNYKEIKNNTAEAAAENSRNYANARGGAMYIEGFSQAASTDDIHVKIENIGEISNNTASATAKSRAETHTEDGETWTTHYAIAEGGGLYVLNSDVEIYDTDFINNRAVSNGGGVYNEYSRGGAIYLATQYGRNASHVTIGANTDGKDVIFQGNHAGLGSDIYIEDGSWLTLLPGGGEQNIDVHNAIRFNGTIAGGDNTMIEQYGHRGTVYLSGNGKDFTGKYYLYDGKLAFNTENNKPVDYTFRHLAGHDGVIDLMASGSAKDVVKVADLIDNRDFAEASNETLRLWVDFDASTGDMDKMTVNAYTRNPNSDSQGNIYNTSPYIKLSLINVTQDGYASQAVYLDGNARNEIRVIDSTITATTEDFTYTFTPDHNTHGLLHIIAEQSSGLTLAEAIADPTRNSYSFTRDYVTNEDLGALAYTDDDPQNARQFTIFGNNHALDGNNHDGVFVQENQILNVENISGIKNFAGAAIYNQMANATENNGVVNIINSSFADNEEDILNSGTLNLQSGNINFASGIKDHSGSNNYGTTNINGAVVVLGENAVIRQNALNINSGSLTAGADQIDATTTNNGTLVLTGGNLASNIGGTGTTQITGDVTNTLGKTFGNNMSVSGSLATNADYVGGNVSNTGNVSLTGGTLSYEISGGTISVVGNTSSNADNIKAIATVDGQKSLTLTGGIVSTEINGQGIIGIGGDVQANADYLKTAAVVNSSMTLTINGGTLTYAVSGTGNLAIETDMTANLVNPITGIVKVAPDKKLTLGANDAFAAADSLVLNDGTTLDMQNGSANAAAIDNIVIADGANANALIKWNDTLDGSLEGQTGTLTINSVDVGGTQAQAGDPAQSYTLTTTLAENIALASDLNLANAGENTFNTVSYDKTNGNITGKRGTVSDIIEHTTAGQQATIVITGNESGGGKTVSGSVKIQGGNGSRTLQSIGEEAGFLQVGDGLAAGATLTIEDVSLGNINTNGAAASVVVKGGSTLQFRASSGNVSIDGSDNGTGIYLEKDDTLGAATALLDAAGGDININDDIRSDDEGNIVRFAGTHEINASGTFDPATMEIDGTLNRTAGYDEAITYNINAGGLLRYSADSILYDAGHHTALTMNTVNLKGGTLRLDNGTATEIKLADLSLTGTSSFYGDVDLANGSMDKFTVTNAVSGAGTLNVAGLNLVSDAAADNTVISFTDDATLMGAVNYTGGQGLAALSPVYRYNVSYDNADGNFTFARYSTGDYTDYNPSVIAAQSAALAGGYLGQIHSYEEAFRGMDDMMSMTESQREVLNSGDDKGLESSLWLRHYSSFEKDPLKSGPKVSNDMHGWYFGYDAPSREFYEEWDGRWTAYMGYNTSEQSYDGIDIDQSGATLGMAAVANKGNIFAGLTVNTGLRDNDVSTRQGDDSFKTGLFGLAAKGGYNYGIDDGKYILQPSMMLSYSHINAKDYTTSAGARINADSIDAIQAQPEIRFIANLNNGWKPYAGIAAAFNLNGGANATANNASLPEMSVKNYVKYGGGAGKSFGDITGYGDVYLISGGRRSVAFNLGISWKFGGKSNKAVEPVETVPAETQSEPVAEENASTAEQTEAAPAQETVETVNESESSPTTETVEENPATDNSSDLLY